VHVEPWAWILLVALIATMMSIDFFGHIRKAHEPGLREASIWSACYISVALLFGLVVLWEWDGDFAVQYYSGYITELSLSVDNLFVFVLIMSSFRVPRKYQQKVLLVGIIIALALRTVFILVGASVVNHFSFVFYIFGAFLIYTAITKLKSNDDDEESGDNLVVRLTRKVFPTTEGYVEDRLTTHVDGKRHITPMLIVMIAIGSADLLFAVDSIPAIFGLTQEVFLIFAANAFSLMGLRQLFFVIDGLLDKLVYLNYGLAAILAFIGGKLVLHALHENELGFINSGQPWEVIPEPTTVVSLVVIVAILFLTTLSSLTFGRRRAAEGAPAAGEPDQGDWGPGELDQERHADQRHRQHASSKHLYR